MDEKELICLTELYDLPLQLSRKALSDYCLSVTIGMLRIYHRELANAIKQTGELTARLGEIYAIKNPEFYFAGYYANIGLIGAISIINKPNVLSDEEKYIVREHPIASARYAREILQMKYAALLCERHHEKPNANGSPRGVQDSPKEAYLINIADVFVGATTYRLHRMAKDLSDAIEITIGDYRRTSAFEREEILEIERALTSWHGGQQ
jgi:HD-GYP domain-containing protein (c-di-GMP phosphodiesterase class II)